MKSANRATRAGYAGGVRGRAEGLKLAKGPEAFLAVLDRYSLEDVIRKGSVLVQMLELRTA